jgi:vacuolar-type H+-ATPase subunit I/STV1
MENHVQTSFELETERAQAARREAAAQDAQAAAPAPEEGGAEAREAPSSESDEPAAATPAEDAPQAEAAASPLTERQRIEEQLQALKRRESELRRALAIADHPALADAIRELDGRVYAVARADEKLAQGLSKSEERRRETLERKVAGLREKRAELDTQIAALDTELAALGVERTRSFEQERDAALEQLLRAVTLHGAAIAAAGLAPAELVPELGRFLPRVQELAERFAPGAQA